MYSGAARLSSLHPSPAGVRALAQPGPPRSRTSEFNIYLLNEFGESTAPGFEPITIGRGPASPESGGLPLDHGDRFELLCLPFSRLYVRCWEGASRCHAI